MTDEFNPITSYRALSPRVLCVARTRIEGAWAAYIDAVPGKRHADEWEPVLERGTKLDEPTARIHFPEFRDLRYALAILLCLLPSLASAGQLVMPDPILSSHSTVEWQKLAAPVTPERLSPVIRPAPWWATSLAVAGPLADGWSTHYALGQSGPRAQVMEGNTFYHKLFGSDVTRNEILAFKVGQAALMGALVYYQGKSNPKAAIATAVITAGINFYVSALNVRNAQQAKRLNR